MTNALNITGQRYGRLVAISNTGKRQLRNFIWNFRCDCGNFVERVSGEVRRGKCLSCGCLAKEESAKRLDLVRHLGAKATTKHGMTNTPEWISWDSMKQRCFNPRHKSFESYGGRGIGICTCWIDDFEAFFKDMGNRPEGTTLERIDSNGNYEPLNCRWATSKEQGNNRRTNRLVTHNGQTKTVKQWAEEIKACSKALTHRLNAGWSVEKALTLDFLKYKPRCGKRS